MLGCAYIAGRLSSLCFLYPFNTMKKITYLGAFLLIWQLAISVAQAMPIIGAATDLKFALEKISQKFTEETGQKVQLNFASSETIFQQIKAKQVPVQLFMSSNEQHVLALANQGFTVDRGSLYGTGRLVLFSPTDSALVVDDELRGLTNSLQSEQIQQFAISDPENTVYGQAAKQVLLAKGLWDKIQPKLVLTDSTTQTAELVSTKLTQGAIFAYTLIFDPQIRGKGSFVLLPEYLHSPIRHRMVLLKNASSTAKAFYSYLQTSQARKILTEYNFSFILFRHVDGD